MSWLKRFGEPIVLRDGARLTTLGDAIAYLANIIPESERDMPEVQTASRLLTNAAEQGDPVDFARIAVLQAIDHHAARVLGPSRKDLRGAAINGGGAQETLLRSLTEPPKPVQYKNTRR